ncbi:fungal-specific transcription factor domain-containing protein [Pseudomassariella vexata]|uniref:Fungal-specific transcription factor domain-domain-containing protein n=1 Tax=Pseudomassariella vexata TaxID=1141098 RepID=A0A1Y2EKW8_9PEZI|nr:fungal-specific transcription factor domain-containing protein [Pseudomassariella vexata]ORY72179.1 fungal-specific transcription factor domain-domain-containing protein [Pseudomassariella vexata]
MATQEPQRESPGSDAPYKRASRKGAPRRFACNEPGCGKLYSRAEHLQRHQLNHNAKVIHRCNVGDCTQEFVRLDLLERHKKRHSGSYVPRNRSSSFALPSKASAPQMSLTASPSFGDPGPVRPAAFQQQPQSAPRNASVLLSPESNAAQTPASMSLPNTQHAGLTQGSAPWATMEDMNLVRTKPGFYAREPAPIPEHSHASYVPFAGVPIPTDPAGLNRDNFAMWLFDPQRTYADYSMAGLPFLEGGLESPFNNNIHYDHDSLTSRSQIDLTPPRQSDTPEELISEFLRQEVLRWVQVFRQKQPKYEPLIAGLVHEAGGDLPGLNLDMMRDCIRHYWDHVSARLPIVHQPTFLASRCSVFLLMVMIALGAVSLHSQDTTGTLEEYGPFADLIITCVRWEILTADEASPPVDLWVAQALLLVEFYEKMCSTRKLHERAHIYHSATLTLLRRGSPLIGRSGSESPPDEPIAANHAPATDGRTWWIRWAETEAMHRVVFAAFMMDVVHAAMFGHTADMAPHEIRLPLPCDDSLWSASTPESVRQQEANLRMYGLKPVSFLDGLKKAIHGGQIQTHSFGRMIIMCGLLSVGWHLSHRETHLKWLDLTQSPTDTREKWCKMLLSAFDDWKKSFDEAMGSNEAETNTSGQRPGSNGLIQSAAVLYHLAHISLYVDIIDCQVYAGAKRLLGRKISTRDYTNVVTRMKSWAALSSTTHSVLHAFKLLHCILVDHSRPRKRPYEYQNGSSGAAYGIQYSCRNDPDPHRPWIMYYATLTIWSYVRALGYPRSPSSQMYSSTMRRTGIISDYLSNVARLSELESAATSLHKDLPLLLDAIGALSAEAHSELLQEAHGRLEQCKEILVSGAS